MYLSIMLNWKWTKKVSHLILIKICHLWNNGLIAYKSDLITQVTHPSLILFGLPNKFKIMSFCSQCINKFINFKRLLGIISNLRNNYILDYFTWLDFLYVDFLAYKTGLFAMCNIISPSMIIVFWQFYPINRIYLIIFVISKKFSTNILFWIYYP